MSIVIKHVFQSALVIALVAGAAFAQAQDKVLNLYSSRHYQTDEALYRNFTQLTGIKINRIEAGEDPLIERLKNEGSKSPADVLVTIDAGRLWRAEQLGLFRPVTSKVLEYLASDEAQAYFANGNNEWPVVKGAPFDNRELASLGSFRMDNLNIGMLGRNQPLAQKIFDRAGYK